MNFRKHLSLIVGLALPVLMILAVAASIYVPRWFAQPATNFVYSVQNIMPSYTADGRFIDSQPPKYYLHDVKKNANSELTAAVYGKMKLDTASESADGWTVTAGDNGSIFGGGTGRTYYLVDHGASYKLNLKYDPNDYNLELKFQGWVE